MRVNGDKTDWIQIQRGVRQGFVLSPDLFSLYGQGVIKEMENMERGRNINNIRYADDTVLLADSEEKLQALVDRMQERCQRKGLKINNRKTETMGVTKRRQRLNVRILIEGRPIKQSETFNCLGSISNEDRGSEKRNK